MERATSSPPSSPFFLLSRTSCPVLLLEVRMKQGTRRLPLLTCGVRAGRPSSQDGNWIAGNLQNVYSWIFLWNSCCVDGLRHSPHFWISRRVRLFPVHPSAAIGWTLRRLPFLCIGLLLDVVFVHDRSGVSISTSSRWPTGNRRKYKMEQWPDCSLCRSFSSTDSSLRKDRIRVNKPWRRYSLGSSEAEALQIRIISTCTVALHATDCVRHREVERGNPAAQINKSYPETKNGCSETPRHADKRTWRWSTEP